MFMKMKILYKKSMLELWFNLTIALVIISQTKGRNNNDAIISGMVIKSINLSHDHKSNNDDVGKEISIKQQANQDFFKIGQTTDLLSVNSSDASTFETDTNDSFNSSDCITIRGHQECFSANDKENHQQKKTPPIINESKPKEEENRDEIKSKYAKRIIKGEVKQVKYVQKNNHKFDTSRSTTTAITMPSPLKGTKETAITSADRRQTTKASKQTKMLTLTKKTGRELLAPYTRNLKVVELAVASAITKSPPTLAPIPQIFDKEPQEEKPQTKKYEKDRRDFIRIKEKFIDHFKLQEIVTEDNNQLKTTTATTTIITTKSTVKLDPKHQININPTNSTGILTTSSEISWPTRIIDTTITTEGSRNREPLSQSRQNSMIYNDFTGKLLAEKDGAIKEIEQKFRLKEFLANTAQKLNKQITKNEQSIGSILIPKIDPIQQALTKHYNNNNNNNNNKNKKGQLMEKRVKKSFQFPMHNPTNFATNHTFNRSQQNVSNTLRPAKLFRNVNNLSEITQSSNKFSSTPQAMTKHLQSEFSTTKFYNNKELYNERQRYNQMENKAKKSNSTINAFKSKNSTTKNIPNSLPHSKLLVLQNLSEYSKNLNMKCMNDDRNETRKHNFNKTDKSKSKKFNNKLKISFNDKFNSTTNFYQIPTKTKTQAALYKNIVATAITKTKRGITSTNDYTNASELSITISTFPSQNILKDVETNLMVTEVTEVTEVYYNKNKTNFIKANTTNSLKSYNITRKSFAHSNNLSFLQEKITSLKCDLQIQSNDLQIWHSNTTHELMLPKMTPENCKIDMECSAMMVSWESESEIQSGDILIVEINDALLNPKEFIANKSDNKSYNVQVYQVTRSGHEHCDVTEGILLDITPLILDDRKLVTLYDKDLTEGVNFLIVVYEGWGSQCVRLKVTMKTDNCGENSECSIKGLCYTTSAMEEYECQCCSGFSGSHCEEIDACTPSPCTNNGICVDLSQGHEGNSYQCLCPYGYSGKNCQYELDPCNPAECMNGGSCVGNSTHFRCECLPSFIGPLCQHSLNKCESSPCIHGICVNQEDGFRCFCQPGFAGELCNIEYNECVSNPCLNQGECIDHIGNYECRCTKGYTGSRCQIKIDFCANKPCPIGHNCLDHGNDYSCECPGGRIGPDCNQIQRMQCNVNPCTHGGTCWSSGDSFYCACRPGYTGTMCEDEYVVETVISSSEFIVDDNNARNFNDKAYDSAVVLKSPIVLHNAYFAAAVLAATIFIVAIVLTICHCKVNQTYRKFSTRSYGFIPILGFGRRQQIQNKFNKHWLSGKNLNINSNDIGGNRLRLAATTTTTSSSSSSIGTATTAIRHYNLSNNNYNNEQTTVSDILQNTHQDGQLHERPFSKHMPINVENDMYYTVDFGETTQHAPLIQ